MKEKISLFYEDIKVGDKYRSQSRTIDEDLVNDFAQISGDFNPIHTDPEFAKNTIYGERIAHGLLGLSVVSGLADSLGFAEETTIAFRSLEWKFKEPMFIGDSILTEIEVIKKRDLKGEIGGLVIFRVRVMNQKNHNIQSGKWSLLIKKRV